MWRILACCSLLPLLAGCLRPFTVRGDIDADVDVDADVDAGRDG